MQGVKPAASGKRRVFSGLDYLLAAICFVAALVLYSSTLLPGTGEAADVAKYHFIGKVLGLSHPPGSPFYILVNWVVAQIPIGELAWRINLMSAVSSALACFVFFLLIRLVAKHRLAALLSTGLLLTSRLFWKHAVTAELYGFFSLLMLTSLLFILLWRESDSLVHYALACAFFGLSFGVHLMAVYFIPGFALYVFRDRGAILKSRRGLMVTLGGAGLGLSTYLLYAIRPLLNPTFSEAHFKSPLDFFSHITGGYFKSKMFAVPMDRLVEERIPYIVDAFVLNLGPITITLGAVGLLLLLIRKPRIGITFFVATCLSVVFALCYDVGDPEVFLLPAILGLTLGLSSLAETLRFLPRGSFYERLSALAVVLLVLWLVYPEIRTNFRINQVINDKSHDTFYDKSSEAVLNAVEKGAVLVSGKQFEHLCFLYHYQGRGIRQEDNIQLWLRKLEDWDRIGDVFERFLHRRPIFFSHETGSYLSAAGIAYRTIDLSGTLMDYMEEMPEGRLLLVAIGGDRKNRYKRESLERLKSMGIEHHPGVQAYRGFLGVKFKKNGKFAGPEGIMYMSREYTLKAGDVINGGVTSPVGIKLAASRGGASIKLGELTFERNRPGAVVAVVDLRRGLLLDHFEIDGGFQSSLKNVMLYQAAPIQPYLRMPLRSREKLGQFLRDNNKRFVFDMGAASGEPMILSIVFSGEEPPEIEIEERVIGADAERAGRRTEIAREFVIEDFLYARDLATVLSKTRTFIWQCREGEERRRISIRVRGTFQQAVSYLHYAPILKEAPEGDSGGN